MLRRVSRVTACLLLLTFSLAPHASAQVSNASVTGLVTDTAGAVVTGASVTVKNKATNVETTTTTDSSGYYTFATVPIGEYTVTFERQGFKRVVIEGVRLEVAQKARVDAALEVGAVTEVVTVTSETLLTTQEATTGGVIDNRLVEQLPLSGRNWDDLVSLVPGVQIDRYTEEGGGTANGRTGGANVHGVRSLQNNFVLDGVDNNSISENVQELTTQVARPSVDSIQEFKVSTNPYSAENGRSPGALISVATKSGTNVFHGTLYEFHRNRIFDANNFFNNRAGARKPQNIQNQFGGNLGGPVVKEKAFFFFNYEGTRIRKGVTRLGNVPLPNEIRGDFSNAAAVANRIPGGAYATLFDRVGDCRALVPSAFNPDGSFINNQIPAQCL
ncbi:MAG TPA: carboxypeptidase-like regulatory domain-containing protein, partial [Pyrinomonadaceae bacterium]